MQFTFEPKPIDFRCDDEEVRRHEFAYDPRVTPIDGAHYVTWCNGYHGPTIGVAKTTDFVHFEQLENAFLPFNRNGVLFPRKFNDKFLMLSRPSDTGHTPFGDIFVSESPDLVYWGQHRHIMGRGWPWFQGTKIGAGPSPIETSEGWLLFYHAVTGTCNGFVYSISAVLLDLDQPWKVIARCKRGAAVSGSSLRTRGVRARRVFPGWLPVRLRHGPHRDLLRRRRHVLRALLLPARRDRRLREGEQAVRHECRAGPRVRAADA